MQLDASGRLLVGSRHFKIEGTDSVKLRRRRTLHIFRDLRAVLLLVLQRKTPANSNIAQIVFSGSDGSSMRPRAT